MNAAYVVAHGGAEVLGYGERPDPRPAAGEVLIAIRAASVNTSTCGFETAPGVPGTFRAFSGETARGPCGELGAGAGSALARQPQPRVSVVRCT